MMDTTTLIAAAEGLPPELKANALALVETMSALVEGIGDEGMAWKPPFLRLVQGTTDRGSIPKGTGIGDFVLGESKLDKPLEFIPLRLWTARQYWNPDQTKSNMLCWSPDALLGYVGTECKTCPFQVWKEDAEGKGSAECGKVLGLLAITSDLSRVFTVNFAKSSYTAGMELQSAMKKAGVTSYLRQYGLNAVTSPKAKAIEIFKVEVLDDKKRRTPAEVVPFLKALFDIATADRKASIEAFYTDARARAASGITLLAAPAETPALPAPGPEGTVQADPAEVSPMSKKYKV